MSKTNKRNQHLIRMAVRLHERLLDSQQLKPFILPEPKWSECERLARLHAKAIQKGWFAAATRVRQRLDRTLQELQTLLAQMLSEQKQPAYAKPTLREIHAELVGLYEEFPNADCNLRRKTVSVITDSITLEEVYLGPFSIELEVASGNGLSDSVIATDPNPAGNDEEVTHPHVRDNTLCEGEGTLPIRRALEEGRLVDFFQVVDLRFSEYLVLIYIQHCARTTQANQQWIAAFAKVTNFAQAARKCWEQMSDHGRSSEGKHNHGSTGTWVTASACRGSQLG